MKKIKKNSAFILVLIYVIVFIALSLLSYKLEIPTTGFFAVCAFIFAMLLPACSLEK